MRGQFKIIDGTESQIEGACLKIYDDPESPHEGRV